MSLSAPFVLSLQADVRLNADSNNAEGGNDMLKLAIFVGLGAAAWFWRDEILAMVEQQFPGIGEKSTRAVENVARSAETAFERVTAREGAV